MICTCTYGPCEPLCKRQGRLFFFAEPLSPLPYLAKQLYLIIVSFGHKEIRDASSVSANILLWIRIHLTFLGAAARSSNYIVTHKFHDISYITTSIYVYTHDLLAGSLTRHSVLAARQTDSLDVHQVCRRQVYIMIPHMYTHRAT